MPPVRHAASAADDVIAEMRRRRADLLQHGRTSLERHLRGVHAMLMAWRQPEHVCLAGLLHSAYSTESFGFELFGRRERSRVRELVGREAEHLIFAFCACKRGGLLRAALGERVPVTLHTRWGGVKVTLEPHELGALMLLHAANVVEQTCRRHGEPAPCLAVASEYTFAARHAGVTVPEALFAAGSRIITRAEERALLRRYETFASPAESPVGEPFVMTGIASLAKGRPSDALRAGESALAAFDVWATAWDKRLGIERWRQLATHLVHAGQARDRQLAAVARQARVALLGAHGSPGELWAMLDALGAWSDAPVVHPSADLVRPRAQTLPPRFARYMAGLRTNAERPTLQFYPGLRVEPWHDPREFPIVADLERLAPEIAREAKGFDVATWQDEAEDIGRTGRWSVQFLLDMGRRREENLARCPSLRWILEHHRTLTTHAGLMYFSCLDARSRVAPHRGPTNVRLRCHLALEVPPGCGIRVGGVARKWEEGRCIVFDDSFEHEVWNESTRRRVVLVLDLWHPDLRSDEVELLAGLHRYGAANETATKKYWARNDAAARKAHDPEVLGARVTEAMRAGDLARAGDDALRYAQLCRPTRWYPVRRDDDPALPRSVEWKRVLTPAKLVHDIEQLEYLQREGILGRDITPVIERYEGLLDTLRPLGDDARVPLVGTALAQVGHVYNRLVHVRQSARVKRAMSRSWAPREVEREYLAERPSIVVVDDFLAADALAELRLFCLESTVWSTNRYHHGRLGSFFRDGFTSPLLVQIAEEIRAAFPRLVGARRPLTQIWGYKYAPASPTLPPHADFAAVNVNFWITPDEANLDPRSGGLALYDVKAPKDWDFATYNRGARQIRELLAARKAKPRHIPYRCNRAVIFDSDLFHATPAVSFKNGYEDRRVNVTMLFGDRRET